MSHGDRPDLLVFGVFIHIESLWISDKKITSRNHCWVVVMNRCIVASCCNCCHILLYVQRVDSFSTRTWNIISLEEVPRRLPPSRNSLHVKKSATYSVLVWIGLWQSWLKPSATEYKTKPIQYPTLMVCNFQSHSRKKIKKLYPFINSTIIRDLYRTDRPSRFEKILIFHFQAIF